VSQSGHIAVTRKRAGVKEKVVAEKTLEKLAELQNARPL
jgi:hypothetical protein